MVPLVDVTAKAVLLYVETVSTNKFIKEAVLLLTSVLASTSFEGQDETLISSIKLQIDPLLSSFNQILTESENLTSLQTVLECGLQMAKKWAELVGGHFNAPALILAKLNKFEACSGPTCAAFLNLAFSLRETNKKWEKICSPVQEENVGLEPLLRSMVKCYKTKCCKNIGYFTVVQQDEMASQLFWCLLDEKTEKIEKSAEVKGQKCFCLPNDNKAKLKEVDQMLSRVASFLENNEV